jgi:hypothetical protein
MFTNHGSFFFAEKLVETNEAAFKGDQYCHFVKLFAKKQ